MRKVKLVALALVASIAFTACGSDSEATEETVTEESVVETETAEATDIVAVASATEGFSTLVAALTAAGLVETLQGEGPFTVFAPNDAAFAALPEGLLEKLLLPENVAILTSILTYHVVAGNVLSSQLTDGQKVKTLNGQELTVAIKGGVVTINGIKVIAADLAGSNGVIHVVEGVILPK